MVHLRFLVLACLSVGGGCLKCFQCNSAADPGCAELKRNDTGSVYYRECPGEIYGNKPILCRKTVLYVFQSELRRVVRSCGFEVHRERASNCYRADTDYKKEESCQCFGDGCNSAGRPGARLALFALAIATRLGASP